MDRKMEIPEALRFLLVCFKIVNLNSVATNRLFVSSRFKKFIDPKGFYCRGDLSLESDF